MTYHIFVDDKHPAYARLTAPPMHVVYQKKEVGALLRFDEAGLALLREVGGEFYIWDTKRVGYVVTDANVKPHERDFMPFKRLRVILMMRRMPRVKARWNRVIARNRAVCQAMKEPGIIPNGRVPLFFWHKRYIYARPDWERPMRYSLRSPRGNRDYPLVIFLHGGGSHGLSGFKPMIDYAALRCQLRFSRQKYHALIPQAGYAFDWNTDEFTLGINAVLDSLSNVDRKRVYITGISYGGYGAIMECCRSPERYAACLSCVPWLQNLKNNGEPYQQLDGAALNALVRTPMWLACSRFEKQLAEPLYEALKAKRANVRFSYVKGFGHISATPVFSLTQPWAKWLFSHKK